MGFQFFIQFITLLDLESQPLSYGLVVDPPDIVDYIADCFLIDFYLEQLAIVFICHP